MGCGQIKDLNCVKLLNKLFNSLTKMVGGVFSSRVDLGWCKVCRPSMGRYTCCVLLSDSS